MDLDFTDLIISDSDDRELIADPETIRKMAEVFERAKRSDVRTLAKALLRDARRTYKRSKYADQPN